MPWSGPTFLRDYSWQADRDNGIRILAIRMDGEFDNYKAGLEALLLRDGSNSPTADINWGGFKITNLANGTAPGEAITVGQLAEGEWVVTRGETLNRVDNSIMTISGDQTAIYHPGRRVRIVHDSGALTSYGTVVNSVFGALTTIVLRMDGVVWLVATIDEVAYGLLSYENPSYLDPRSKVEVKLSTDQVYVPSTPVKIDLSIETVDSLNEYDTGLLVFTAEKAGAYLVVLFVTFETTETEVTNTRAYLTLNGNISAWDWVNDGLSRPAGARLTLRVVATFNLVAEDYISAWIGGDTAGVLVDPSSTPFSGTSMTVHRIA